MKKNERTYLIKALVKTEEEVDNWNLLLQDHRELAPRDKPNDEEEEAKDLYKEVAG